MAQVNFEQIVSPDKKSEPKSDNVNALVEIDTLGLNAESLDLLNQLIAEQDVNKAKDLTYLFNINQNKKTMVRLDRLSGLQDKLVGLLFKRVEERPDEIPTQEVMQALKIVQDIMDRGLKQVTGTEQAPLIQINQQDNSVNVGKGITNAPRESRERVKNAILEVLNSIQPSNDTEETEDSVVDFTAEEPKDGD